VHIVYSLFVLCVEKKKNFNQMRKMRKKPKEKIKRKKQNKEMREGNIMRQKEMSEKQES